MPWWRRTARAPTGAAHAVRPTAPAPGVAPPGLAAQVLAGRRAMPSVLSAPAEPTAADEVRRLTVERLHESLRRHRIRFRTDPGGAAVALWEGHSVLFAAEGPDLDILVVRARADATVPPDWADRAYTAVNEWNTTRRLKSFVGRAGPDGGLPVYAELQLHLGAGVHDALLDELVGTAAGIAGVWADWLRSDGGLL